MALIMSLSVVRAVGKLGQSNTDLAPDDPDLIGTILAGSYRITEVIDRGGMGVVYGGEHVRLRCPVAVKVLPAHMAAQADIVDRFRQEAELISALSHPHVVSVLDFDFTPRGEPYIVMERLRGEPLATRLDREGHLPLNEAVDVLLQVSSALGTAHAAGIVHRDLKPGNIFLLETSDGTTQAKLIDFGIGRRIGGTTHRITMAGRIVGTPEYMAPEQVRGEDVDGRVDQYALALVGYEMLSGTQPFCLEGGVGETLRRVLEVPVPPLSLTTAGIPECICAVITRGLEKEREDRFPRIEDFARDLAFGVFGTASSRPPPPQRRPGTPLPFQHTAISPKSIAFELRALSSGVRRIGLPFESGETRWKEDVNGPPSRDVALRIGKAEASFRAGSVTEAALHAAAAVELALQPGSGLPSVLAAAQPLLERIFRGQLGAASCRLQVFHDPDGAISFTLTPRSVSLLRRLENGMSVQDALDVAAMPQLETMARLSALVSCGAIALDA